MPTNTENSEQDAKRTASDSSPRFIHAKLMYVVATAMAKTICHVFTRPSHWPDLVWTRYGGAISSLMQSSYASSDTVSARG